jgi:hypothetical protein
MRNNERKNPCEIVGLGKKTPILGKLMQPIGILLLFLAGLSGSEDIIGKKCAYQVHPPCWTTTL